MSKFKWFWRTSLTIIILAVLILGAGTVYYLARPIEFKSITAEEEKLYRPERDRALEQLLVALKTRDLSTIQKLSSNEAYARMSRVQEEENFKDTGIRYIAVKSGLKGVELQDAWLLWQRWAQLAKFKEREWYNRGYLDAPISGVHVHHENDHRVIFEWTREWNGSWRLMEVMSG
jgi:hypothetical protein